jgi:hypothetical protein
MYSWKTFDDAREEAELALNNVLKKFNKAIRSQNEFEVTLVEDFEAGKKNFR